MKPAQIDRVVRPWFEDVPFELTGSEAEAP